MTILAGDTYVQNNGKHIMSLKAAFWLDLMPIPKEETHLWQGKSVPESWSGSI